MTLPVVAIVGRPNVGKSSLFNCLTASRDALVASQAGLTRDRQYGVAHTEERSYIVIDTGGLTRDKDSLARMMERQVQLAVEEADLLLWVVDARAGLTAADEEIAERLRRINKTSLLAVNKADDIDPADAVAEFYRLGFAEPLAISAAHRRGIDALQTLILESLPPHQTLGIIESNASRLALLGRPNSGKSTLMNRLLGQDRVLTQDAPGTTRDAIAVPFTYKEADYLLIDTAGVRRRARVGEGIEKLSVIKALQAVEQAQVVILLLDAGRGIADQDAHLAGLVIEAGASLVLALNKWDSIEADERRRVRGEVERKLKFAQFAPLVFISALHGSGIARLMAAVNKVKRSAELELSTHALTRILEDAVSAHPPPVSQGRAAKLRYAHAGGHHPLRIIIHGNRLETIPASYRRYLSNTFRERLDLVGTSVRLIFKTQANPFAGRRNKLTGRQQQKRKRLMRHVKRR